MKMNVSKEMETRELITKMIPSIRLMMNDILHFGLVHYVFCCASITFDESTASKAKSILTN